MSDLIDLVIPNIAEFNLRHPSLNFDPATVGSFLNFGCAIGDQSVFWSTGPRVLTMYPGFDKLWFMDVHNALGAEPPPLVSPVWRSGRIVTDLLTDPNAMAILRRFLRGHDPVRFVTWGATESLYQLAAAVRSFGHEVALDIPSEEHYWSSLYLDSKVSCVDLATQIPGLRVAPCITTHTWPELRGVLSSAVAEEKVVIVRSAYGTSGEGTFLAGPDQDSLDLFWVRVRDDPMLRVFPLLVQPYLPHQPDFGCPAVDMLITDGAAQGGIADLVPSVMTVDGNRFVSVNIGDSVLPVHLTEEMAAISRTVAAVAQRLGFRGWFGIDFILDRHGDLYITEFNARRTGGTEWIPLLDRWKPPRLAVAHAQCAVPLPAAVSYTDLRPVFEDLWRHDVAAYPTAVRRLSGRKPSLAIVTCGADTAEAERHATRLHQDIDDVSPQRQP